MFIEFNYFLEHEEMKTVMASLHELLDKRCDLNGTVSFFSHRCIVELKHCIDITNTICIYTYTFISIAEENRQLHKLIESLKEKENESIKQHESTVENILAQSKATQSDLHEKMEQLRNDLTEQSDYFLTLYLVFLTF